MNANPPKKVFLDFVDGRGRNLILAWTAGLPDKARARLADVIAHLEGERSWRNDPYVRDLSGKGNGLIELRITAGGRAHRPIAFYGPGNHECTIVLGAEEINDKFDPPDALETAQQRKKLVLKDRSRTREHEIA